jgi:transcriptional regulator with XRE-family HTH domain
MQLECNLREQLGERLKQARSGLGLTQKELCFRVGMPLPSIKDYETCKRLPGADAICVYVRAGINANWLLTGEGPMLLADLVDATAEPRQVAPPPPAEIDQELLALCIEGVRINAGPNDSAAHQAKMVMEFYRRFLDMRTAKPAAA